MRYTDDFVIVTNNEGRTHNIIRVISHFLEQKLNLQLHPKKIIVQKIHRGIDFLGYVLLPHHRALRSKTKARIFRKLSQQIIRYRNGIIHKQTIDSALQSYLGVLSHANTHKLGIELKNQFWFWLNK